MLPWLEAGRHTDIRRKLSGWSCYFSLVDSLPPPPSSPPPTSSKHLLPWLTVCKCPPSAGSPLSWMIICFSGQQTGQWSSFRGSRRRGWSVSQHLLVLAIRKCFLPLSSPPTTPGHTNKTLAGRDAQMAASKPYAKLTAKASQSVAPTADMK